jgi:hypothetical protein
VLLDKDRLLGAWVDGLLAATGVGADRDNAYYWETVRPLEYATLERIAFDHLELGKVVVIDAPLRPELSDPSWVARVRHECESRGAGFLAVWVIVSPETARRRMTARAEPRDHWKPNWREFCGASRPIHRRADLENEGDFLGRPTRRSRPWRRNQTPRIESMTKERCLRPAGRAPSCRS